MSVGSLPVSQFPVLPVADCDGTRSNQPEESPVTARSGDVKYRRHMAHSVMEHTTEEKIP